METSQLTSLPEFENYETIKWLGSGGSGNAYLVKYKPLKQLRVIKQIKPDRIQEDPVRFQEYFRREAEMLAKLSHPNIVKILDFNEKQGYLVMEFANGGTLRELLNNDFPEGMVKDDLKTLLGILEPIVNALTYSHQDIDLTTLQHQGLIHLDLKPSNILIHNDKKGRHYLVADFSIARWLTQTGIPEDNSWLGAGTEGYWAPEQHLSGRGQPTIRSDIYSLGIMIHEMLSGQRPRDGVLLSETISAEITRVIRKATNENPSERYMSVQGFFTALKNAVEKTLLKEGDPDRTKTSGSSRIRAKRTDPIGLLGAVLSQKNVLFVAIVLLLVLGVGSIAWFLLGTHSSQPTHATQPVYTTQLGGLDLSAYCTSLHYDKNTDKVCSSKINLDQACNWQWSRTDLHIKFKDPSNLYSGICYDSHGVSVGGGISNMEGYCKQDYLGMPEAVPDKTGDGWICQQEIDATLACRWELSRNDVQARRDDQGVNWTCYGPS